MKRAATHRPADFVQCFSYRRRGGRPRGRQARPDHVRQRAAETEPPVGALPEAALEQLITKAGELDMDEVRAKIEAAPQA